MKFRDEGLESISASEDVQVSGFWCEVRGVGLTVEASVSGSSGFQIWSELSGLGPWGMGRGTQGQGFGVEMSCQFSVFRSRILGLRFSGLRS